MIFGIKCEISFTSQKDFFLNNDFKFLLYRKCCKTIKISDLVEYFTVDILTPTLFAICKCFTRVTELLKKYENLNGYFWITLHK